MNHGQTFNPGPWRAQNMSVLIGSGNNNNWVVWNSTGQSVASHLRECEAKLLVAAYRLRHELVPGMADEEFERRT